MNRRDNISLSESPAPPQGLVCERKFTADVSMLQPALDILSLHCIPDPRHPEGEIESVYFDNPAFSSYWEKLNGDILKRKVRIRWYPGSSSGSGTTKAFLEVKDRICAARDKQHLEFETDGDFLDDAPLEDEGWTLLLRERAEEAGVGLYDDLEPVVSIRYKRYRFVCPLTGSRISLDYDLRSPRGNGRLFPGCGAVSSPVIVCEAKSATHRSWSWTGTLARYGFKPESFSKYGLFMDRRFNGE